MDFGYRRLGHEVQDVGTSAAHTDDGDARTMAYAVLNGAYVGSCLKGVGYLERIRELQEKRVRCSRPLRRLRLSASHTDGSRSLADASSSGLCLRCLFRMEMCAP